MEHQHQAGRFVSWLWAHAHHALLALTIASIALLLQQASQFARFDVASRGVMSYWQAQGDESSRREMRSRGYRPVWDPTVAGDRPLVMIVPHFLAQADDARLHPIDFAVELIRGALRQEPRILAINIDVLDPYFDDERANDPLCDYLFEAAYQRTTAQLENGPCDRPQGSIQSAAEYLRNSHIQPRARLIKVLSEASPKTTIVVKTSRLPLSFSEFEKIIFSQDSIWQRIWARRFSWAFDLCRITNVRVALDVPQQFRGMAFEREIPTLGNVVWQATQGRTDAAT